MSAKASPSAVIPSPRPSQRPQSNAVQGARLKAAIAVPLSFLAFILLLVGVFTFHLLRHRLADEPAIDAEKVDLARQSSLSGSRSVKGINDIEKALDIKPETVPAPAPVFSEQNLREDKRRDVGTSPHQAFLMSPSLRQNPISSLHVTPTTVPASVFRSLTHARAIETHDTMTSPAVPIHLHVSPLSPSPLRKTLAQDEDEEPS